MTSFTGTALTGLLTLAATAAPAMTSSRGITPGGAAWRIESLVAGCRERGAAPACFEARTTQVALAAGSYELRHPLADGVDAFNYGGLWWDRARPAQGFIIEELDRPIGSGSGEPQHLAVSWYTWAPRLDADPGPRWLHGVGQVHGHLVGVDLVEVRGGRFGALLDPANIRYVPWGRVELDFRGERALARYAGPAAYGNGELHLQRLTKAGSGHGQGIAFSPPPIGDVTRAGTYYDPRHPAGGWVLNQYLQKDSDAVGSLLLWFTWDSNGRPIWLYGIDPNDRDGLSFRMHWAIGGGRFEPGYALADVNLLEWGDVWLPSSACGPERRVTQVDWRADTHGFGDGHVPVARLTRQVELHAQPRCWP